MDGEPVTVSMYNVGFGDCFLLRVPGEDRERRVLIDCGSIKSGAAGPTSSVVEQIIEDVTDDGVPHIDVVAVTHRHKDHVSGFTHERWRDVVVDEVWMPWTEDPDDPEARRILEEMAAFELALEAEAATLNLSDGEAALIDHVIENTLTLSNDKAMATLHRGFRGGQHEARRRFVSRGDDLSDALSHVAVHVLGPSREVAAIREMNPPSAESFLRALRAAGAGNGDSSDLLPFNVDQNPPSAPSDDLRNLLRRISEESALLSAVALEKAVNNTSLMLAFEVGEAVLFFPGDSQWGSWKVNLDDPKATELLRRTSFYKVGHHDSHNATPVSFVHNVLGHGESSDAQLFAATSVAPHGRFKEIPRAELLEELRSKIGLPDHVIRSDEPPLDAATPSGVSVLRRNGNAVRIDFDVKTV